MVWLCIVVWLVKFKVDFYDVTCSNQSFWYAADWSIQAADMNTGYVKINWSEFSIDCSSSVRFDLYLLALHAFPNLEKSSS